MNIKAVVTSLLIGGSVAAAGGLPDPATLTRGRAVCAAFKRGDFAAVARQLSPEARKALGDDKLAQARASFQTRAGDEQQIKSEEIERVERASVYTQHATFTKMLMDFIVSFDDKGQVISFRVKPPNVAAPSDKLEYKTKTKLRLPFDGEWYVAWGGRSREDNQHAESRDARFAYDFLIAHDDSTHRGEGKENKDYYSWGQPVRAPGAGHIVAAVDGVPENVPGQLNFDPAHGFGNHVIIDHGNGEFSILAHFVTGSVAVKVGQAVEAGALLGKCGNSGRTSEPHVHYHMQDTPRLGDGVGLPAQFHGLIVDGEPTRGQLVRNR